jgi:hypothetical protein
MVLLSPVFSRFQDMLSIIWHYFPDQALLYRAKADYGSVLGTFAHHVQSVSSPVCHVKWILQQPSVASSAKELT